MSYKRKQYVVDKKFQLGTTLPVIGFTFLVVGVIIALIAFNASWNNKKLSNIVDVQDNIVQALINHASMLQEKSVVKEVKEVVNPKKKPPVVQNSAAPEEQIELKAIASDHYANIEDMKKMVRYNSFLLYSVVFLVVIQGIVLFALLILKTHRIAGPIYVMSMYLNQIKAGKVPEYFRPLRQKDELKEFYNLFKEAMPSLKKGGTAKKTAVKKAVVKKAAKKKR